MNYNFKYTTMFSIITLLALFKYCINHSVVHQTHGVCICVRLVGHVEAHGSVSGCVPDSVLQWGTDGAAESCLQQRSSTDRGAPHSHLTTMLRSAWGTRPYSTVCLSVNHSSWLLVFLESLKALIQPTFTKSRISLLFNVKDIHLNLS